MKTLDIEYAVAKHLDFRKNNIIPNISWGVGIHECDLLIIKPSGWTVEVEIKVSVADCKADLKKDHCHNDERIQSLYFAIPESIYEKCKDIIPEHAGIYTVSEDLIVRHRRGGEDNKNARKLTPNEIQAFLRLGNMRTWGLRKKMIENCK